MNVLDMDKEFKTEDEPKRCPSRHHQERKRGKGGEFVG
jgi:hypothetical protein